MGFIEKFSSYIPEITNPTERRVSFKTKLKWTLIILILFYVLGLIPIFGLSVNQLQRFEFLSVILAAKFGSIVSLGIGPLVTASIVLQLLVGSGILKFDLTTIEGKKKYESYQKFFSVFFIFFESVIYVIMGGLTPPQELRGTPAYLVLELFMILQLVIGGLLIMFMDGVVSKWGFGSGISLFIAAGVSQEIFVRAFSFMPSPTNPDIVSGAIPGLFQALSLGDPKTAAILLSSVLATIFVFVISVYGQAMKVEIPLSFGRVRGYGLRWPLAFMYTSNIPVILIAALMANIQLFASLVQSWVGHGTFLGTFVGNTPVAGLAAWLHPVNFIEAIITGSLTGLDIARSLVYMLFLIIGSVIFSLFWVQTSGMGPKEQAKQIMASGLQIPGFRRDERVLERLLSRYIWPLTILGGAAVGFLAAIADLTGALSRGTGILLTVMIIYRLYEEIAKQHMMDMHPALRKFIE